jgi:predicted dehydrogenase
MSSLSLGLIGVGKHGWRYASHLVSDFTDLRLVAIARRDAALAEQQSRELRCKAYLDYRELLAASDVDAVIVVTPPTVHPAIIAAAAEARKPVLLEKPAAVNVTTGREILHCARAAGIAVMVAQTLRFNGVVRALLEARPRLGRVHSVRIGQRFEPSRPGWIGDVAIAGGGMMLHTGVHCFDLVRLLSGLEVEQARADVARVGPVRTEDNFSASLRLSGGMALASVAGSRATASRSGGIELVGESGQLIADHLLNYAYEVHGTTRTDIAVPPPVATVRETIAAFTQALRRGTPMPIALEEGLRAVAIAEACYRSAESGGVERVADIAPAG